MLRPILFLCYIAFVFSNPADHDWRRFKVLHSKQYSSPLEEFLRMNVYLDNKKIIDEHNERYSRGLTSYSMEINEFGDWTDEEFHERFLGLDMTASNNNDLQGSAFLAPENVGDLPETVDWRDSGAVTPVKNQGQCGSCWAFSATGALEAQTFRKTNKLTSLSEQNLLDCTSYNGYGNSGCEGGIMDNAFRYIVANGGVDTEESYPYEESLEDCRFNNQTVGSKMSGFVKLTHEDEVELAQAVAYVGPVSAGIDASNFGFRYYKSGVYYDGGCYGPKLNHAILIIGYGTEFGQDYWLVKNSWSTRWGDQGYIKMARNRNNHCGIARITSYPLV